LLWKKTRTLALIASLVFHLFNSITLQIGIFPYFALTFALFFYPPEQIRAIFLKRKPQINFAEIKVYTPLFNRFTASFLVMFMFFQFLLPLRHYVIKGDVLWTDEAHRLSWRMMLRSRNGYTHYKVVDKNTGNATEYDLDNKLTYKQKNGLITPDMIWQMAQHIKQEYARKGIDVAVYADSWVSINDRDYSRFIDEKVDLANEPWNYFSHHSWILERPF